MENTELIDLSQFSSGQVIEHTNSDVGQSWLIVSVRKDWLKVTPLFSCYTGDRRENERFSRSMIDSYFGCGWWRIRDNTKGR